MKYYYISIGNINTKMCIFSKIKNYREINEYSQLYVGSKLGISQQAYSKLENGESLINIAHLNLLAKLYEIPVYMFLYNEESEIQNVLNSKNLEILQLKSQIYMLNKEIRLLEYKLDLRNTQIK